MIVTAYRAVEHFLSLISALFHMTLQLARLEGFQKLKTAEEFPRDRHDGPPVVKLSAILVTVLASD